MTRIRLVVRMLMLSLAAAGLTACAALDEFLGTREAATDARVPISERPLENAIDGNRFWIESSEQSVIGAPQVAFTRDSDALPDFAREYGLGYDELIAANPGVNIWLPGENTPVLLPTQFVLPNVPREGLVLNIATKRLFYFPSDGVVSDPETGELISQIVLTFPIGIGRVGWETPLGSTAVTAKAIDPHWWVPASVRKEHAEMGDPLPAVVPPGPDNPLGSRVLKLGMPGYLIHGTNQPYGVGMRVSHGCVRLYPENIEFLYELVEVGEPVMIINEPYLLGRMDGEWYFESHQPLEDDASVPSERLQAVIDSAGAELAPELADQIRAVASTASGVPVRIAQRDDAEVLARARRVRNTVELDPDAPTLEEVRQMIDEVVAEAELEASPP